MKEFDSEYGNVRYVEADQAVLLTWKKFACLSDYREPASFALSLLQECPESNLVVDARNGFEDDKEDAEWGVTFLLPEMAKTTCKFVCFIMHQQNDIEEEMDFWTREFGKYFSVIKAPDYEKAIAGMKHLLLVDVNYRIKAGKRDEFLSKVKEQGIIQASKEEPGNYKYAFSVPIDSDDQLCLLELWVDEKAQAAHGKSENYQRLQSLKKEYVTGVEIKKYWVSRLG